MEKEKPSRSSQQSRSCSLCISLHLAGLPGSFIKQRLLCSWKTLKSFPEANCQTENSDGTHNKWITHYFLLREENKRLWKLIKENISMKFGLRKTFLAWLSSVDRQFWSSLNLANPQHGLLPKNFQVVHKMGCIIKSIFVRKNKQTKKTKVYLWIEKTVNCDCTVILVHFYFLPFEWLYFL